MLWSFFLRSLAIGCLTFGGGYAMISALHQEFVTRQGWLTPQEFSNGVAVGQLTPGPLMIMIAFVGYKLAGFWGAVLGTVALFIPSACLVLILAPYYQKVRAAPAVQAALKGVNAAVVALLMSASIDLGRASLSSLQPVCILVLALILLNRTGLDTGWVLVIAGIAGALFVR